MKVIYKTDEPLILDLSHLTWWKRMRVIFNIILYKRFKLKEWGKLKW